MHECIVEDYILICFVLTTVGHLYTFIDTSSIVDILEFALFLFWKIYTWFTFKEVGLLKFDNFVIQV